MTFFSAIFNRLYNFIFASKRIHKLTDIFIFFTSLAIALEIMMSIGYFIKIGSFEVGYSEFIIVCDTVISLIILCKKKCKNKFIKYGFCLVITCLLSLLIGIAIPYDGAVVASSKEWDYYYFLGQSPHNIRFGAQHAKEIIHVVCYALIMIQFYELDINDKERLVRKAYVFQKPF